MDLLEHTVYRADVPAEHEAEERSVRRKHGGAPWRPAIHMPRWASRITLEVTEVRVQRLHDISEENARAEGVQPAPFCRAGIAPGNEHREAFHELWDKTNGKRATWAANCWVWVVSFRRLL